MKYPKDGRQENEDGRQKAGTPLPECSTELTSKSAKRIEGAWGKEHGAWRRKSENGRLATETKDLDYQLLQHRTYNACKRLFDLVHPRPISPFFQNN